MQIKRILAVAGLVFAVGAISACNPEDPDGTTCSTDSECENNNEICRDSQCVRTCDQDSECGGMATCELDGVCLTSCQGDGDCGENLQCKEAGDVGKFCWDSDESFDSCENGEDAQCAANEYCGKSVCIPFSCSEDSDCLGKNICDDGVCRSGCTKDSQCEGNRVCGSSNTCRPSGCTMGGCGDHQMCDTDVSPPTCKFTGNCDKSPEDDAVCDAYGDQMGADVPYICDEDAGTCVVEPPCEGDGDCDADQICIERADERNICRDGCRCTDAESNDNCDRGCSAGEICNASNRCVSGCQSNSDCATDPNGDTCIRQRCVPSCEETSDCQEERDGLVCRSVEGERVCQKCTRDGQCPTGDQCAFDADSDMDDSSGLCRPTPPPCPKDGYGDNHELQDAKLIEESDFPFRATDGGNQSKPKVCRNPASNDAYQGRNGDWWKFQASAGKVIEASLSYNQPNVGDINLQLVNGNGDPIVSSVRPPGAEDGEEKIIYGTRTAATYYLHITQALQRGVENADYNLEVDVRDQNCKSDSADSNSKSNPHPLPADMKDTYFVCGGDKDFYELDAGANQNVTVTVTDAPERLGNINLKLTDPKGGTTRARQDMNGRIVLTYNTTEASKLRLRVQKAQDAPGNVEYGLKWTQSANQCYDQFETNDSCPGVAHQLNRTTSKKTYKNLSVCTDDDFYAVDLLPRDRIKLESVYQKSGNGVMTMTMFGPDNCATLRASASASSVSGGKERLTIDEKLGTTEGGTYYINIKKTQGPNAISHNLSVDVDPGPNCVDDDLEPNDSRTSSGGSGPTQLSRSSVTSGGSDSFFLGKKICDKNVDWYCVGANSGDNISWDVEFDHSNGDLNAYAFDPSGQQVDSSTSTSDDESVSISGASQGDNCLKVEASSVSRNEYDVFTKINGQPPGSCPDIYEDNDSCSSSSSCNAATPSTGASNKLLSCSGDDDWYETCVTAGQTLDVKTTFTDTDGNIDLEIFEEGDVSSRTTVPGTDGTSQNNDEEVSVYSSKDQCYYYRVSMQTNSAKNAYDMTVTKSGPPTCPDDKYEPNDKNGNATQVEAPGLYVLPYKCESNPDWYKVDLDGKKFEAFINHDHDLGDVNMEIYQKGSLGSPVKSSNSSTDDESIVLNSPANDTYFLKVTTGDTSRLPYDLLLYEDENDNGTFEDDEGPEDRQCPDVYEENDTASNAAQPDVGTTQNLQMCAENASTSDDDWYEIFVPKDATITAKALFTHADGNIDMKLFRKTSTGRNQVDKSQSTDDDETVSKKNSSSGSNYLVRVTGNASSSLGFRNSYDLEVSISFSGSCPEDSIGQNNSNFSKSNAYSISAKDYDMADGLQLCENTEDWFKFTTPSSNPGQATFGLSHTSALGEINIAIRDGSGVPVGTVTDVYGNGNIKVAEATLQASKTYYVRVYPDSGVIVRNPYDLWASWSGNTPSEPWCPDQYERNDDRSTNDAAPIGFTNRRAQFGDAVACGSEDDWYKIDLMAQTYNFDTFFTHDGDSDVTIEVRDSSGNVVQGAGGSSISFSNDSSDDDEQAEFTPGSSGTFYLGVRNKRTGETDTPLQIVENSTYSTGSASSCSNYEDQYEPNNTGTAASSINSSLPVSVEAQACDADYFTWKAPSSGTVNVDLLQDNSNANFGLVVKDLSTTPPSTVVYDQGQSTSTTDNRATGTFNATSGDTYQIEVTRGTDGSGSLTNGPYILRLY